MTCRAIIALALFLTPLGFGGCKSAPPQLPEAPAVAEAQTQVLQAVRIWRTGLKSLRDALASDPTKAKAAGLATELLDLGERTESDLTVTDRPFTVLELLKNQRERFLERARAAELFDDFVTPEDSLWKGPADLLLAEGDAWLDRRADLFARKYFHDPNDDGGNFIEGVLNSNFELFRSVQIGDRGWQDTAGVSPWEAVARLEPFAPIDDLSRIGIIAGLGTTYHYFPSASQEPGFMPSWVQRLGLRVGAGYIPEEGENGDVVFGGAVHVRSLSVWALWQPEDNEVFVAVGAADFRWLSDLTTWF